jgi:hypothetical protein
MDVLKVTAVILAAVAIGGCGSGNPSTRLVTPSEQNTSAVAVDDSPKWASVDSTLAIDGVKTFHTEISGSVLGVDYRSLDSTLHLRKRGKRVEVFLVPPQFVGSDGGTVRWKIDSGSLHSEHWSGSEDGTALFASNPYGLLEALEHPGDGHKLILEYPPFEKLPEKAEFALPASVPDDFRGIAGQVLARERTIESLRNQYYECMKDPAKSGTECGAIAKRLHDGYGVSIGNFVN